MIMDDFADWIEESPFARRHFRFFTWDGSGDIASWFQHAFISLTLHAAITLTLTWLGHHEAGVWWGRRVPLWLYGARETIQAVEHLISGPRPLFEWRWTHPEPGTHRLHSGMWDNIGDMLGPVLSFFL